MMRKPHVLFMFEYWRYGHPHRGVACHDSSFRGSLEGTGLATFANAYFDTLRLAIGGGQTIQCPSPQMLMSLVSQYCHAQRPDLIVYEPIWKRTDPPSPPGLWLAHLGWQLRIPMVGLLFDSGPCSLDMYDVFYPMVDTVIVMDARKHGDRCPSAKFRTEFSEPHDDRLYYPVPEEERDFPIAFAGTMPGSGDREFLWELEKMGYPIHIVRTARNQNPGEVGITWTPEEYAAHMRRAQMVINCGADARNGRVFGTLLCGALLFEPDTTTTHETFTPGVDYVPYGDRADLTQKLDYYLAHPDERRAIARQGLEHARQHHAAGPWWSRLFALIQSKHGPFREDV